jgi:hypothetical protein
MKWTMLLAAGFLAGLPVMSQAADPTAYREIVVRGGGAIRGRVLLEGNASVSGTFEITKDKTLCGLTVPRASLLLGRENGVRNAVVYVERIAEGKKFTSKKPCILGQSRCQFEPHLLLVPAGVRLEVVNNDPVLHNIHAYNLAEGRRALFNIAQPIKGQRTLVAPDQLRGAAAVLTTCDAGHPWMSAYVIRADHPYYAVTDADGRFALNDVPPGSYTLKMWHEGVALTRTDREKGIATRYTFEDPYIQSRTVTVAPHGIVQADFELRLR